MLSINDKNSLNETKNIDYNSLDKQKRKMAPLFNNFSSTGNINIDETSIFTFNHTNLKLLYDFLKSNENIFSFNVSNNKKVNVGIQENSEKAIGKIIRRMNFLESFKISYITRLSKHRKQRVRGNCKKSSNI